MTPCKSRVSQKQECPYYQSVMAKKLEYIDQFYNTNNQLVDFEYRGLAYVRQVQKSLALMDVCEHHTRKCRAKFMCHSCYHSLGNSKFASKCGHTDKPHHSRGLCKNCYHRTYYNKKMQIRKNAGSDCDD